MKKRVLYTLIGVGTLSGLLAFGATLNNQNISKCNKGDEVACNELIDLPFPENYKDRISNPYFADKLKLKTEATAKVKADAEAKEKAARRARTEADLAALKTKNNKKAAEQAKLDAQGEWDYSTYTDQATGQDTKQAWLTSKNQVNWGFPYSGPQNGKFTIRNHPRHGVDAYLKIERGQLLCDNYSNTTVLIRFDNAAATPYSCTGPADHSTEIVFIRGVGALEIRMKTAKTMYVTVNVYQQGSVTFRFNVRNYDRSKV